MTAKPYHRENLRELLIEAGIKLMNEKGFSNLSLREIAKQCQTSHSAPYRHFSSKEELLNAMRKHIEVRFVEVLENAIRKEHGSFSSMIEFGKAYVSFFLENPEYYTFFTHQDGTYVNLSSQTGNMESNYKPFLIFKEYAESCLTHFGIPPEKHFIKIIGMWAIVHGIAGMATITGVHYDGNWEELTELILKGE